MAPPGLERTPLRPYRIILCLRCNFRRSLRDLRGLFRPKRPSRLKIAPIERSPLRLEMTSTSLIDRPLGKRSHGAISEVMSLSPVRKSCSRRRLCPFSSSDALQFCHLTHGAQSPHPSAAPLLCGSVRPLTAVTPDPTDLSVGQLLQHAAEGDEPLRGRPRAVPGPQQALLPVEPARRTQRRKLPVQERGGVRGVFTGCSVSGNKTAEGMKTG